METKEKMEVVSIDKETKEIELLSMREAINYLECFFKKETIEIDLRNGKTIETIWDDFKILTNKGA